MLHLSHEMTFSGLKKNQIGQQNSKGFYSETWFSSDLDDFWHSKIPRRKLWPRYLHVWYTDHFEIHTYTISISSLSDLLRNGFLDLIFRFRKACKTNLKITDKVQFDTIKSIFWLNLKYVKNSFCENKNGISFRFFRHSIWLQSWPPLASSTSLASGGHHFQHEFKCFLKFSNWIHTFKCFLDRGGWLWGSNHACHGHQFPKSYI